MKGKVAKKFLAVASAVVLVVSGVVGDYCTAYAAVSITEAGEYFLQMMCSAIGVYIDKSNIGLVLNAIHHVADQQALIGSPEFQEQVDYMLSLSPADRIDEMFSNSFLKNLCGVFSESTVNEDGHGGGGISFNPAIDGNSDFPQFPEFASQFLPNGYEYGFSTTGHDWYFIKKPTAMYVYRYQNNNSIALVTLPYPYNTNFSKGWLVHGFLSDGVLIRDNRDYNTTFEIPVDSLNTFEIPLFDTAENANIYINTGKISGLLNNVIPIIVPVQRVWIDAYDDAALHVPVITAPISIPVDVADMNENLKSVSLSEDKAALYKALAAAGIAINIDIDVPDETDKPTDAEIPDDGSVSVGKSLSDILAAITGLADKVAAIPSDIAAFFTPDMTAVSESFDSLKDSLMLKFGGLLQLADVFNRSYKFDTVIPVIKIPIPDNETLRTIFDQKTELVILDLTPFASDFQNFRSLLTAMLYVAFAFWFLDEFDVKIHIG